METLWGKDEMLATSIMAICSPFPTIISKDYKTQKLCGKGIFILGPKSIFKCNRHCLIQPLALKGQYWLLKVIAALTVYHTMTKSDAPIERVF